MKYRYGATSGFTLIEIMVAIGVFAIVMALVSGAYLIMINANRRAQSVTTGTNNLSYALENMTRNIRTGTHYQYNGVSINCSNTSTFIFTDVNGNMVQFFLSGSVLKEKIGADSYDLTDSSLVTITDLKFYSKGCDPESNDEQASVVIVISGSVPTGPASAPEPFTIETSSSMRGSDIPYDPNNPVYN